MERLKENRIMEKELKEIPGFILVSRIFANKDYKEWEDKDLWYLDPESFSGDFYLRISTIQGVNRSQDIDYTTVRTDEGDIVIKEKMGNFAWRLHNAIMTKAQDSSSPDQT